MTPTEVIERALKAIGLPTSYQLGAGAAFDAPHPADESGACDCSGFVCWVLGIYRYQPVFSFLRALNGGWMNTDGMVEDSRQASGYFESVPGAPSPGDLIIYPSLDYARKAWTTKALKGPRIGHVGILSGDNLVIHCSAGNERASGDAIQETGLDVFLKVPYYKYIRFTGVR